MIDPELEPSEPDMLQRRHRGAASRTPQPDDGSDAAGFASLPAVTR